MCNVYAIPAATITWMHIPSDEVTDSQERMNIQENREGYVTFSTLMLSDVTFADRGEFICTAENEHNMISSTASLEVFGKLNGIFNNKQRIANASNMFIT